MTEMVQKDPLAEMNAHEPHHPYSCRDALTQEAYSGSRCAPEGGTSRTERVVAGASSIVGLPEVVIHDGKNNPDHGHKSGPTETNHGHADNKQGKDHLSVAHISKDMDAKLASQMDQHSIEDAQKQRAQPTNKKHIDQHVDRDKLTDLRDRSAESHAEKSHDTQPDHDHHTQKPAKPQAKSHPDPDSKPK